MNHSPGPWELTDNGKLIITQPTEGYITRDICRVDFSTMSAMNQKANAKLIAAAPDLLEALRHFIEDVVDINKSYSDLHYATELAKAAIAKATGEINL